MSNNTVYLDRPLDSLNQRERLYQFQKARVLL
jgi:hypothetical protein